MYDLGEQFKIDLTKGMVPKTNTIVGNFYRISVLSPRLVRLEFSRSKRFVDNPTFFAINRNFPNFNFDIKEDVNYLEITTNYFKLTYVKENDFSSKNLKVTSGETIWTYGSSDVRNYGLPGPLIDGEIKGDGLFSENGISLFDDSKGKLLNSNGTSKEKDFDSLDLYLFVYKNDYLKALNDYYFLTGYPSLIPRYALGVWWSKNEKYDDLKIKELIDTFEKKEIPVSIILLDKDWHKRKKLKDGYALSGFTFNNNYFKSPVSMIQYMHGKHIKMGLDINPTEGFYDTEEYYKEALKYVNEENGKIPFNVYDPKIVDLYLKLFIHPLDNLGVDFYFLDVYNPVKPNDLFLLKYYQYNDKLRSFDHRPLLLGYDDRIASQRYPVLYSGKATVSWDTLRKIPNFNIEAFNNGVSFWAHDVSGYFNGTEDSELYIRFLELSVFSPIFKFGVDDGKYYKREPWKWDIKTYNIAKNYMNLRHSLIPYIYSESYKYTKGTPLIIPVYYQKRELYDDPLYRNEYYFGSEFLVCPILNKKDNVMDRSILNFYLPDGTWYDYVTGKKFPGGHKYVSFFKDEDYPVFVKSGSIIPLAHNNDINDTKPPKDLEIQIFPGTSNSYLLYEDDGETTLYKKGFYIISEIEYNYMKNNYSVIIRSKEGKSKIIPDNRNYKIVFRNTKRTDNVTVYSDMDKVSFKTYVDGPDFIVEVKNVKTIGQLTINCRGNDIEIDAAYLINQDIESILSDAQIETKLKEKLDKIFFSDMPIRKKRIEVRKLKKDGLDRKYVKMFLRLLEYMQKI